VVNFNEKSTDWRTKNSATYTPEQFSLKQAWVQGVNMVHGLKIAVVEATET